MFKKILVTGATGFMGHHIVPRLQEAWHDAEIFAVGRKDCDLLAPGEPDRLLREIKPDCAGVCVIMTTPAVSTVPPCSRKSLVTSSEAACTRHGLVLFLVFKILFE